MNSFSCLQTILTQETLLQYPDFIKPIVLTCDASGIAVRAILSQEKIGHYKPIELASRNLNSFVSFTYTPDLI